VLWIGIFIVLAPIISFSQTQVSDNNIKHHGIKFTPLSNGKDKLSQIPSTVLIKDEQPVTRELGDFYYSGGKKITLLRAIDEVAVQYKEDITPEDGFKSLMAEPKLGSIKRGKTFKHKRIGIIHRVSDAKSATTITLQTQPLTEILALQPNVQQVYPVLISPDDKRRMVATDEILLCLKPGVRIDDLKAHLDNLQAEVVQKEPAKDLNVYLIRLQDPKKIDALAASIEMTGWLGVQWAEPNFLREIRFDFTPDDPMFSQQQSFHNTGQNGGLPGADVDAPEAWDVTKGTSAIIVAVIDDGVDTSHSDLNIQSGGYDFYNNDSNPSPTGTDGHGTGCAGIAAAIGNNTYRISGIAANCKILPVKIAEGDSFSSNKIIGNAIRYAADRADILSDSWGGGSSSSFINSAIDYAVTSGRGNKGCPVFFATGNLASGWYYGGPRWYLLMTGLSGSYYFGFQYTKDATISQGSDCAWIDNVCILESDGYTQRWREDFEGSFPPDGWSLISSNGLNLWFNTTAGALAGTGGSYSPRSGYISHNQWTELRTPLQSISGNEVMVFADSVSSEAGYDKLIVRVYDSNWNYIGYFSGDSGVPSIVTDPSYPASYTNSIAVGAATDCDLRSDYSQYGSALDFVASSNGGWNDIVTLDPTGSVGWTTTDYKTDFGGTSAACPMAAGICALILSSNPNLTVTVVKNIMQGTCDKIGGVTYTGGWNTYYGYGRVNAYRAVRSLTTVDVHASSQPNLFLPSWNDSEPEKMSVLKFRITDHGEDNLPTLVDQLVVDIGGTGGHAANDIAWAELYDDTGGARVSLAASITNTQIVFGSTPNSDNSAQLDTIPDNSSLQYTLYIYLNTTLQAGHGQTYIFAIDETNLGVDGGNSSRMFGDTGAVTPVTGTIFIESLGITVNPATWNIGPVPLNDLLTSGPFTLQNTGNIAENFTIQATDGATSWTLGGNPGQDIFKAEVDKDDNGSYETLTKSPQGLYTNVSSEGTKNIGLRYNSPTGDTVGGGKPQGFTIVLTASRYIP
jgi:subtilisin family serine protease